MVERPESEGDRQKGDPARDLGTLHHLCLTHIKELQTLSKTQVMKKLPSNLHSVYEAPKLKVMLQFSQLETYEKKIIF